MSVEAIYFDGETATDHAVTVRRLDKNLEFSGTTTAPTTWSIAGLHPVDPPAEGHPFRLTHDLKPGARLIVRDQAFIDELVAQNSHLKGGYSWKHVRQVLGWTAAGAVAVAALGYFTMTVLPQQVAGLMPQSWRDNLGAQVVKSLTGTAKRCNTEGANAALSSMVAALAEGGSELPPVSIEIYDMSLVNAFAAPGGRIILTRGLINEASEPGEVTGVLAHELGHVYHLHPEAQMVRMSGLQILASAVSGGVSSDIVTSAAGLAAILRYTRSAEREADEFARDIMLKASIDPIGLKHFFEKLIKLEGKKPQDQDNSPSALERIGNVFSTHPGTEERISNIQPLPAGKNPVKVMTDAQWRDLRDACR